MDKLRMQTANKADENFKKLAAMFPNAVTETVNENGEVVRAIDKDVLMQEISLLSMRKMQRQMLSLWILQEVEAHRNSLIRFLRLSQTGLCTFHADLIHRQGILRYL